ncbi:MAG: CDP-alcohol phosphatidyltransferase family protein [Bdellovibrionales bacterium]|nr:CDP-alcohol phosphatidyltransferase family protein [Bdellovibrionales bacterium]
MSIERRPLKTRSTQWAQATARWLAQSGITPNQISLLSILMSLLSMVSFFYSHQNPLLLLVAALFIQLRLACNLFDGMVAVEHHKKSRLGDIFNDAPDRLADVFIIMGAALASTPQPYAIHLGWAASILAVLTAYIRVLGSSLGTPSFFVGPMAKPHRMALLTVAAICEFVFKIGSFSLPFLYWALIVMVVGTVVTNFRRLFKIKNFLEQSQ